MIKIDGVVIPTPSKYTPGIMNITKSERNAAGKMIMEIIAVKRKLEMSWGILTSQETSDLLNAVSGTFFTVEYPDPQTKNINTGEFYVGDRVAGMVSFNKGVPSWSGMKFNLIER